ncbi:MAG: hypothetical protein HYU43_06405, partial [Armatimonadetes bacterium]|nr:hypothetical protein [Armatimonadota bacterium]
PKCKPRWQALKKKLVGHPKRKGLPAIYRVFLQHTKNEIEIFRDENVPIEAKEAELQQQYQKVCGAMTVTFDGREQTLPMMAKYLEETDRAKRQAAWETTVRRRLQDRETIDKMFDELIALRTKIATNAGFANYRDYAFRMRGRFDYTPEDCLRFHDAVEKRVVPALRERHRIRARKLGVDPLRPWDLSVDPLGRPPLRPFEKTRDLIDGCRRIFHKVDPDFAKKFDAFRKRGYLDLESRKGKAPGGYMSVFDVERMPFIFMNAAGRQDDVETLLHEGGHSFHSLLAAKHDFLFHRNYPIEFAEVASMGMELLGAPYLGEFYEEEEARRAVEYHLEFLLTLFPWICSIDAFQHQVYQGADRQKAWIEIRDRILKPEGEVSIAVVGKYTGLIDAYKSLAEALHHGGIANNVRVHMHWMESETFETGNALHHLDGVHGILVPGGFGERGSEGKIAVARFARERRVPYFGICFGMQMAVIEAARNLAGLEGAGSSEFGACKHAVVGLMTEWLRGNELQKRQVGGNLGGTMR